MWCWSVRQGRVVDDAVDEWLLRIRMVEARREHRRPTHCHRSQLMTKTSKMSKKRKRKRQTKNNAMCKKEEEQWSRCKDSTTDTQQLLVHPRPSMDEKAVSAGFSMRRAAQAWVQCVVAVLPSGRPGARQYIRETSCEIYELLTRYAARYQGGPLQHHGPGGLKRRVLCGTRSLGEPSNRSRPQC